MRACLALGRDGPEELDCCPALEEISDGVLRIGHAEECTDVWWRVLDPAVLLGRAVGETETNGRLQLLQGVERDMKSALRELQNL
eukprot:2398156-Prymnesium_polylepis.1